MIHILRGLFTAAVYLECDLCGRAADRTLSYDGVHQLGTYGIRLRVAAQGREGWGRRTLADGGRGDVCRACRRRTRARRRGRGEGA